jgi:acyl-CoA thioesterase-2
MTHRRWRPPPPGSTLWYPRPVSSTAPAPALASMLDGLLAALTFEQIGDARFRAMSERQRFPRVFGGQLLAQALHAAAQTVADPAPSSLHAQFVRGVDPARPLELEVERSHDGRSVALRQVVATQDGRTVLLATAAFHENAPGPSLPSTAPVVPAPDTLPTLQEWAERAPDGGAFLTRTWIDVPPPLEIRMTEPPTFLGGAAATDPRAHWMRLPRPVAGDAMNAALLAYASDYFLVDVVSRAALHDAPSERQMLTTASHSIWFHRPVRFDEWHLYVQEAVALVGSRGLARGAVHDREGVLVATTAQEVMAPLRREGDEA